MFRFAAEFGTSKFRLLGGRRVAPSSPPLPIPYAHHQRLEPGFDFQGTSKDHRETPTTSPHTLRRSTVKKWTRTPATLSPSPSGRGDGNYLMVRRRTDSFATKLFRRILGNSRVAPSSPRNADDAALLSGGLTGFSSPSNARKYRKRSGLRVTRLLRVFRTRKVAPLENGDHPARSPIPQNVSNALNIRVDSPAAEEGQDDRSMLASIYEPNGGIQSEGRSSDTRDTMISPREPSEKNQRSSYNLTQEHVSEQRTIDETVIPAASAPAAGDTTVCNEENDALNLDNGQNYLVGEVHSPLCSHEERQAGEQQASSLGASLASPKLYRVSAGEDRIGSSLTRDNGSAGSPHRTEKNNSNESLHRVVLSSQKDSAGNSHHSTSIRADTSKSSQIHKKTTASKNGAKGGRTVEFAHCVLSSDGASYGQSRTRSATSQGKRGAPSFVKSPRGSEATKAETELHCNNILKTKPADLAKEMSELSPRSGRRRIQDLTAHIKQRVDLRTVGEFGHRVLPYTSDEEREIEENARRAEELLDQLKTLIKEADKRNVKATWNSSSSKKQAESHGTGHSKYSTQDRTSHLSTRAPESKIVSSLVRQPTLQPQVSSKRNTKPRQLTPSKTTNSKKAAACPALNKRTFRKSHPQQRSAPPQPKPVAHKDLTALGLPVIQETELEQVLTGRGAPVKLGSGDYGEVHLMRSRADGTLMAVKRLTDMRGSHGQDKRTADMLQEIRAMEAVKTCRVFPRFLGVLDHYSFAQEFVGNRQKMTSCSAYRLLYKSLRGPHLLPLDWMRICRDVTEGLGALHRAGWTHNDLHVGNIMVWRDPQRLTATWEGKIIDLGRASPISNPPPLKTLNFMERMFAFRNCTQMAPEIVEGRSQYNVKSDVYSLGVVLNDIAKENRLLSCFKAIGDGCVVEDASQRPELELVLNELNQLYHKFTSPKRSHKTRGTR